MPFWPLKAKAVKAGATGVWTDPYSRLRGKWHEVPAGDGRVSTADLARLPDTELVARWQDFFDAATQGEHFRDRGWYQLLYKDVLAGKRVMDVGSGLGFDAFTFAGAGAHVTCVDIVESNLSVLKRLCALKGLADVGFCYLDTVASLRALAADYDVLWCQGSMLHAPFEVVREEAQELLRHLRVGGRWIELAYPRERWEREGRKPFNQWGVNTDGENTPWAEWYDIEKVRRRLAPAQFDVVMSFNFDNDNFIWFDLVRRA